MVVQIKNPDYQKELTPIVYGESSVKILRMESHEADSLMFKTHWHDRLEILRIISGKLYVNISGNTITAEKDTLVIFNPCQPHTAVSGANGVKYFVVMFDVDKFFNSAKATNKYLKPLFEQNILLNNYVDDRKILKEVDSLIELAKSDALLATAQVYMLLGRFFSEKYFKQAEKTPNNRKFYQVTEYLNKHFSEEITLSQLSRTFGYNESYLCQKFKECTGLTITNYINILRLEKAQELLKNTDKQISEIAYQCGFNDLTYFSHCFKKYLNISPANYRKEH